MQPASSDGESTVRVCVSRHGICERSMGHNRGFRPMQICLKCQQHQPWEWQCWWKRLMHSPRVHSIDATHLIVDR